MNPSKNRSIQKWNQLASNQQASKIEGIGGDNLSALSKLKLPSFRNRQCSVVRDSTYKHTSNTRC